MLDIRKNFLLKILSLVLAILGWGYFRFVNNPIVGSRVTQQLSVPIVPVHLAVGSIARLSEKEAVVTVTTPRRGAAVRPDDVRAVVDLENHPPGVYNAPVQIVAPNVPIQSLSPASVTLAIERVEQRAFPIGLNYVGSQTHSVVATDSHITPPSAQARGASGDLVRITSVRVDVPLPGSAGVFDAMVRPAAVDSLGREVANVQVSPNLVRVRVQFIQGTAR